MGGQCAAEAEASYEQAQAQVGLRMGMLLGTVARVMGPVAAAPAGLIY